MGREIRRVPIDWEHPRDESGRYKPLYGRPFDDDAREWINEFRAWMGKYPDGRMPPEAEGDHYQYFWEYDGNPPDPDFYRPDWPAETMTAYQVYETVSEGTPISPVFVTQDALRAWLLQQGHSERAADAFIAGGWAPSMVFVGGTVRLGIDSLDAI